MIDLGISPLRGWFQPFQDLVLISVSVFLNFLCLLSCSFPFLLNNLCLGKCGDVPPWCACEKWQLLSTGEWACWSLVRDGWPCYRTVFCSARILEKSQGDGRGLSEFLFHLHVAAEWSSSICLLWSCNSFEGKKISGWAFKALSSSWELCLSQAYCCTSQICGKGKGGCFTCRKIHLLPYQQK